MRRKKEKEVSPQLLFRSEILSKGSLSPTEADKPHSLTARCKAMIPEKAAVSPYLTS